MDLSTTKGASSWLSILPLAEHGFVQHKSAFHDALALQYGWPLSRTPLNCAYGTHFSVDHALSCPKGGLPILCVIMTTLLTEVCHEVQFELQPVSSPGTFSLLTANTQDGARLDIAMNGFGGCTE